MACLAYLINLPRDAQRRERMQQELAAMHLRHEWVEAVYGKTLSDAERRTWYDEAANQRRYHQALMPGEIGCYASHLQVAQRLLDSSEPYALVLEDDVHLLPELRAVLDAIARLPAQWDMIKLVGRDQEQPLQSWPWPDLQGRATLIRYRRVPSRTGAYLLSRSGAHKLLQTRRPFFRPVDVDLRYWWENDLQIYGVQPYPIDRSADSAISTINTQTSPRTSHRWRKLFSQWHYSWRNRQMNQRWLAQVARWGSHPFDAA